MIDYTIHKPLISIHIPKTGGTSFRRNLEAWYGRKLFLHYKDEKNNVDPAKARIHKRLGNGFRRNVCIHGHLNMRVGLGIPDYYPDVDQFITWVRDPVEVQVSLFSHQLKIKGGALYKLDGVMNKTDDVDEFLEKSRCTFFNHFPAEVTEDNLQTQLDTTFIHVGALECANRSLEIIAQKLGKKIKHVFHENATKRTQLPSESSIRRFKEKSRLEYRLFDMACELNK